MKASEFSIGCEFYMSGRKFRCTDVGSRAVVAICLEPHEVVESWHDEQGWHERREISDDPSWFNGPPYAVVEHVIDEYDLDACQLSAEEEDTPEQ
jgi:hypothetical protein